MGFDTFHMFVICAYGQSPYLKACIRSLRAQTVPTKIICTTSSPSPWLEELLKEEGIPLYIREGESNIQEDWNFAVKKAESRFVTIAHQDDLYSRHYVEELAKAAVRYPDMTVFMSDGVLIKQGKVIWGGAVEAVKKVLRLPWRIKGLCHFRTVKRSGLLLGNPVMCPSCSYQKALVCLPLFSGGYDFVLDWECMRKLAEQPGRFVCVEKPLLYYRIHDGTATKACIQDHRREREEQQMFEKMWPRQAAAGLMKAYRLAYRNYQ